MAKKKEEDIVEEMFNSLIDDESEESTHSDIDEEPVEESVEETVEENEEPTENETDDTEIENVEPAELVEEHVEPEPRHCFIFKHQRRDLIFVPGTGGNFFATMIYDKLLNQYFSAFNYNEKINEYEVAQNLSQLVINGDSRNNICAAIRSIPIRLERMRDYIIKLQEVKGTNRYDWMIADMNTILSVAHRLTVEDLHYVAFSDFLISKNDESFPLERELELMGPNMVGEFYDNLHDLFYEHMNGHALPYMTDIGHIPYHMNTFKPSNLPVNNYSYAVIIAHEQHLYTTLLMKTKHLLRKKSIKDDEVLEIRGFIEKHLNSKHATYEYMCLNQHQEMHLTNAQNKNYANQFFYKDMIIDQNEDKWAYFYEFFGFKDHFWKNKNRLLDKVSTYHEKNIELILNFATMREISFMLDPYSRLKS